MLPGGTPEDAFRNSRWTGAENNEPVVRFDINQERIPYRLKRNGVYRINHEAFTRFQTEWDCGLSVENPNTEQQAALDALEKAGDYQLPARLKERV